MPTQYNNINTKDIQYLNKDFTDYRQALIDFAKTYYPTTYNDFSPADPGTMFIEMAAYVGDVLSYYQDNQIQENFLQYAKEKDNLLTLAYMFGYKPKVTTAATTLVDVFQLLPSTLSGGVFVPDYDYALIIGENAVINSTTNTNASFITLDKVDFGFSSSMDPTEVSVFQINNTTNNPEYYLLKKSVRAISGEIKSTTFSFGAPTRFPSVTLNDNNIVNVVEDMCKKAGFTNDKKQLTMKCAIRGFITKLRSENIIDDAKAREMRETVSRVEQKKQTAKNKLESFKRVFKLLASQVNVKKGGPSVRPQQRPEPQVGEPSRPMTISDLPEAKTIEQIQRMR